MSRPNKPSQPASVAEQVPQPDEERIAELLERTARALFSMKVPHKLSPVAFALTMAQGRCLWTITRREKCTLRELSEQLGVRPSTASPLVDSLVRAGLVQREANPQDRRMLCLSLTVQGRDLHLKHEAARREQVARFLEPLTSEQRAAMLGALTTFDEIMREVERRP